MEKKMKFIAPIILMPLVLGCNYLDINESTGQDKEYTYSYFKKLEGHVTHLYSMLSADFGVLGGALREAATDNAVYTWNSSPVYRIYEDAWSPINTVDDCWEQYYEAIRSANMFLESFSLEDLKRFEHNESYATDIKKASMYPYEARFLRAYYYFELIKRYGDVPLLKRVYSPEEINTVTRSSFDSVVKFIVEECDQIVDCLPVSQAEMFNETGRVTKGAVMALKSRVLLYAASKLHNEANSKDKWKEAADAAMDLIIRAKNDSWYSLVRDEPLFGCGNDVFKSRQLILERRGEPTVDFEQKNLPIGFEGANSGNTPTQNLVDSFEMSDGSPFSWDNPEHAAAPYENRDPRLYKTVVVNGSQIMKKTVETYYDGANGQPNVGATMTGYYLRKYIDETTSLDPTNIVKKNHHYVLFRYAEILLNYAEAMNEFKGPEYKDTYYMISAREALNEVRACAGMPLVEGLDDTAFREKVRNERRVELAFEDHRFWDIRRWKIGDTVEDIYGVKIIRTGNSYSYTRELVQTRVWKDKMYLYPIPQSEIYINGGLGQNPGWN